MNDFEELSSELYDHLIVFEGQNFLRLFEDHDGFEFIKDLNFNPKKYVERILTILQQLHNMKLNLIMKYFEIVDEIDESKITQIV